MSKMCKGCGMPKKNDSDGDGTNADGTRNPNYCSYCWAEERFMFEGTVEQIQEMCRRTMIKHGTSKFLAWLYTRGMKRLPRWKNV